MIQALQQKRQRIAIIGSGLAGLASAYWLSASYDIVLYESERRLGGHMNAVDVTLDGVTYPVDTGFLTFNAEKFTYFSALLNDFRLQTYSDQFNLSVSLDEGEFEWANTHWKTFFTQRRNLFHPQFWLTLKDIARFNRSLHKYIKITSHNDWDVARLLKSDKYSDAFIQRFVIPVTAALWSCPHDEVMKFPAHQWLRLCERFALMQLNPKAALSSVFGSTQKLVQLLSKSIGNIRYESSIQSVVRQSGVVVIKTANDVKLFDEVVFACHPAQILSMTTDTSELEKKLLSVFRDRSIRAFLHTDLQLMPTNRDNWAATNIVGKEGEAGQFDAGVSFWLNPLQRLPFSTPVLLSLDPKVVPYTSKILGEWEYRQPVIDFATNDALNRLRLIQGKSKYWYAGTWTGDGTIEAAVRSALKIAKHFNVLPDWAQIRLRSGS